MIQISIIIPCFNQGHFLADAIESVLAQDVESKEVIVVDDGSTDNCREVTNRYPEVIYIYQENQGPSSARNRGLRECNGEFVGFLDSDDFLGEHALSSAIKSLHDKPDAVFTYGAMQRISIDGASIGFRPPSVTDHPFEDFLENNLIPTPGLVLFKRVALVELGGYDEKLRGSEDYDLYLRMVRHRPITSHSTISVYRRDHPQAATRSNPGLMLRSTIKVLARQKRYVRQDRNLLSALKRGLNFYIHWYGESLLTSFRLKVFARDYLNALKDFLLLIRVYRQSLFKMGLSYSKSNVLKVVLNADEFTESKGQRDAAQQFGRGEENSRSVGVTLFSVKVEKKDWTSPFGVPTIIISVKCQHSNRSSQLYFDDRPIDTIWVGPNLLFGYIEKKTLSAREYHEMYLLS